MTVTTHAPDHSSPDPASFDETIKLVTDHAKLVPNVGKLGLLDANDGHLRRLWGEAGLLHYEFAEDTGSDCETYDAVAADRAAAPA